MFDFFVVCRRNFCMLDPGTKAWVLSTIGKLMSQMGQPVGHSMRDVLEKYVTAVDVESRQVSTLCGMPYIPPQLHRTRACILSVFHMGSTYAQKCSSLNALSTLIDVTKCSQKSQHKLPGRSC